MAVSSNYKPDTPYRQLPDKSVLVDGDDESIGAPFFDPVAAANFPKHILRFRNSRHDASVGLDELSNDEWLNHFGRFEPLPENLPYPHCMRYHGHQFRHYNPDLGDGRGFLFAQLRDNRGRLLDLATKGSGETPYSRAGDGRLTLKGGVREVLATEMLEALGVNTSKTFSIIETRQPLERNDEPSPTRSAVMVRLSHSHIRFGTFQMLAATNEMASMQRLVDYCITHFYPDVGGNSAEERAIGMFNEVIANGAKLAALWMAAGFVHGVLNTDNMNITGESFDYGPWRFTEFADPDFTAAYFDQQGLYAYGRQADAVGWNLSQLGAALAHIVPTEQLSQSMEAFPAHYSRSMVEAFFARLGIRADPADNDKNAKFIMDLLRWMRTQHVPIEQFFFDWFGGTISSLRAKVSPIADKYQGDEWQGLVGHLKSQAPDNPQRLSNPYFSRDKPCTMLIDEVEFIWSRIDEDDDWSALEAKIEDIGLMREALGLGWD